ncbi:MAG: copper-translocating P-type ATPase [Leifsonia sp.]|nr:copper-translocating P-type ATPase [Leifsonia sp.]
MAESGAAEHGAHDNAAHEQGAHDQGAHEHSAHEHSAHDPARFKRLFWITLVLTIPTLVFSTGLQDILGLSGPRFPGSQFIPAAFGLAIFVIGGRIFLQGAWHELRVKSPGMMTLISLALVVAFGYSAAVTLGFEGMDFWWELSTLVVIMLLGHWIEMSAVMGAQNALGELAKLVPDTAERVRDAEHAAPDAESERVPTAELRVGDLLIVRPGERVPADGEIVDGEAELDESLLTGESAAVAKIAGDTVIGGSVVAGGALVIKVAKLGDDTALAGIMRLVSDAQTSKSGQQLLADRVAALLFYVAVAAAVITLLVWYLLMPDDPAFVINRVVTVLVIACPHALGLAIPLVAQLSTSIGAQRGILIRERAALETAREIDVVVFDKTGTLTRGELALSRWVPSPGQDEQEILRLAGAVESRSEHPIARAIVTAARSRRLKLGRPKGFTALAGRGASAIVDGRELRVVSGRQITAAGLRLENGMVNVQRELAAKGHTLVYLAEGDQVLGLFALADAVREESAEAVKLLKQRGIRVAMMTGDSHAVADWVAAELGIDEVYAEVLPEQKAATVARIQNGGMHRVAMVGDGVNDAPALATADLGIAIGAGTDVAIESAGIVLASSDPRGVADAIALSRATYRKMLQNLGWAAGYNVVGLPLAAGVLAGVGFLMPPAVGAIVMSASTVVVALNAQLLRFVRFAR